MPIDPGPYDLSSTRLVLGPHGDATPVPVGADFYQALDRRFGGFAGHLLVAMHEFDAPWPAWEMHPKGDEMVYLLYGDIDFVMWTENGEKILSVDRPGSYILVPKGVWHTARPRKPTAMLFVTPGEATQHAAEPPAGETA